MHADLTPEELEDAYENGAYIPNSQAIREEWPVRAKAFREVYASKVDEVVGPSLRYDYIAPHSDPKGTLIFVHGGYWRFFGPSDWSWVAEAALTHGWNAALLGYPLAPQATIPEMTKQIRRGVEAVAARSTGPIVLAGHSAGGQLVARMAMSDGPSDLWPRIAQIVPISPVTDLRPLLRHPMNADLQLTAETALRESPTCQPKAYQGLLHTWVGLAERPAFLDQARALQAAWGGALTEVPDRHHFDILEELAKPDGAMAKALFQS